MLNFPQVESEQLRRMRTQLFAPTDSTWHGVVTTLLQMLIDNDLAHHRTASLPVPAAERPGYETDPHAAMLSMLAVDNSNKKVQDAYDPPTPQE
jgi:hypothetical protein